MTFFKKESASSIFYFAQREREKHQSLAPEFFMGRIQDCLNKADVQQAILICYEAYLYFRPRIRSSAELKKLYDEFIETYKNDELKFDYLDFSLLGQRLLEMLDLSDKHNRRFIQQQALAANAWAFGFICSNPTQYWELGEEQQQGLQKVELRSILRRFLSTDNTKYETLYFDFIVSHYASKLLDLPEEQLEKKLLECKAHGEIMKSNEIIRLIREQRSNIDFIKEAAALCLLTKSVSLKSLDKKIQKNIFLQTALATNNSCFIYKLFYSQNLMRRLEIDIEKMKEYLFKKLLITSGEPAGELKMVSLFHQGNSLQLPPAEDSSIEKFMAADKIKGMLIQAETITGFVNPLSLLALEYSDDEQEVSDEMAVSNYRTPPAN